jgi:hypothetical protein
MGFDDLDDLESEEKTDEQRDADRQKDVPKAQTRQDSTQSFTENKMTETTTQNQSENPSSSTDPAFPFDATSQEQVYVRPQTWTEFEDLLDLDVEAALRDRNVRDVEGREKHDAALRVLADHADEIAEAVVDARRE